MYLLVELHLIRARRQARGRDLDVIRRVRTSRRGPSSPSLRQRRRGETLVEIYPPQLPVKVMVHKSEIYGPVHRHQHNSKRLLLCSLPICYYEYSDFCKDLSCSTPHWYKIVDKCHPSFHIHSNNFPWRFQRQMSYQTVCVVGDPNASSARNHEARNILTRVCTVPIVNWSVLSKLVRRLEHLNALR